MKFFDKIKKIYQSLKGLTTISIATALTSIIGAIFWFSIAAVLGTEQYGQVSYLLAVAIIASKLSLLGSPNTLMVYVAKGKKDISIEHIKAASRQIQKDRVDEVVSSLSHHSKVICMVLAAKTYVLEKEWHSTKSIYDKYAKYLDSEPVSYRRCSELLKDLENTGLVVSKTGSKGQKGYSSEFQLVMDPGIVGEIINKEWWEIHSKKNRIIAFPNIY